MATATAPATARTTTVKVTKNVDTSDPMLPGDPRRPDRQVPPPAGLVPLPTGQVPPALPPYPQVRRRSRVLPVVLGVLGGLVLLAGAASALVRVPYDTLSPGLVKDVEAVVDVDGHPTYPADGEILYATVSVRQRVSALQAFVGWLDPATDVVPEKDLRGDIPPDRYRQMNVEAMNDSKTMAQVLALRHLGYTDLGAGAKVVAVVEESPAASVLRPDDVLVEIDRARIRTSGDAVAAIRARQPGDTLRMRVVRGGTPVDVETVLARADDGAARLGVRLTTEIQLPFEINIDSGRVVGPSAGLAYGLELLDILTPGELTGGVRVAATGELGANGAVGAVGGIAQKVAAVERAGAKVFLVPKANEAEARARAGGGLDVRGVGSYDEALAALGTLQGSNALALAKPSPGA